MGGSPKAPPTASGKGNQPAERLPESNRGCRGLNDSMKFVFQQVRVPYRMALAEVTNLINDLVTTVKPGVRAGPHKTCS